MSENRTLRHVRKRLAMSGSRTMSELHWIVQELHAINDVLWDIWWALVVAAGWLCIIALGRWKR
jgi:hypothetical protein